MTLSMKQLNLICLVIVVTISVACGYLVTSSGAKKKSQIRQENEMISRKLNDLNKAETNLEYLNRVLNDTKKELASLNEKIPESAAIGLFLKELDALMKEREIALISVQPQSGVKEKLYTRIPIRLMFNGSFGKVYNLLHDLENMGRTVVMNKMTVAKSGSAPECRVDLTASIFEHSKRL